MPKLKDIKGQRFGRLIVTSRAPRTKRSEKARWSCVCDCGNTTISSGADLRKGHTQSCGCLRRERASQKNVVNEVGNKYGNLTVIEEDGRTKQRSVVWKCQCDCGNIISVRGSDLRNGHTQSCGCLVSKAESTITNILNDFNINYETQYIFSDLLSDKLVPLRFDFAIFKNNKLSHLIEYDGEQHTNKNSLYYSETIVKHDKLKNQYCETNGIELRRFSGGYKSITLEDLI